MIDFRLDDLYNTEAVVVLPDGEKVVVRTLTEAEVQLREQLAIARSAAVEADIKAEDGKLHTEMIEPLQQLGREELIAIILAVADVAERMKAEQDIPYVYVPAPEGADDAEKRKAMMDQEEVDAKVRQMRSERVSRELVRLRERLDELEDEKLVNRAVGAFVQSQLYNAKYEEFMVQTVVMATRKFDGEQRFDLETVRRHGKKDGLSERVFQRLLGAYGKVDSADPWELQKKA
ncbi:MAG: hypothetical protein WC977_14085 [Anaerovoracaceae bacterium]